MKHISISIYLLPLLLSACSPVFYAPTSHNVPMLQEKNDVRITTGLLRGHEISGVEAQVAYSPVNHVGLMLNYTNAWAGEARGYQIDGGVGGYIVAAKHFSSEGFVGFGTGHIDLDDGQEDYIKFFVQPAIGFTSDYFDVIFSTRFGGVNITGADDRSRSTALVEPALTLRAGYKFVKFQFQYCFSYLTDPQDISYETNIINLGLSFSIAPRWSEGRRRNYWYR